MKKHFKKHFIFVMMLLILGFICVNGSSVFAVGISNPIPGSNSLGEFFKAVVNVVLELGTIISVLGIMYGGFLYATAQGNEEQLSKAYKTITWALVGTAVLLGSKTIMSVVSSTIRDIGRGV